MDDIWELSAKHEWDDEENHISLGALELAAVTVPRYDYVPLKEYHQKLNLCGGGRRIAPYKDLEKLERHSRKWRTATTKDTSQSEELPKPKAVNARKLRAPSKPGAAAMVALDEIGKENRVWYPEPNSEEQERLIPH